MFFIINTGNSVTSTISQQFKCIQFLYEHRTQNECVSDSAIMMALIHLMRWICTQKTWVPPYRPRNVSRKTKDEKGTSWNKRENGTAQVICLPHETSSFSLGSWSLFTVSTLFLPKLTIFVFWLWFCAIFIRNYFCSFALFSHSFILFNLSILKANIFFVRIEGEKKSWRLASTTVSIWFIRWFFVSVGLKCAFSFWKSFILTPTKCIGKFFSLFRFHCNFFFFVIHYCCWF